VADLWQCRAQKLDLGIGPGTELRLDVLNIGDAVYEGTGAGAGSPQFGIRRTIFAGLTLRFSPAPGGPASASASLESALLEPNPMH
jgi:hypothetical protein